MHIQPISPTASDESSRRLSEKNLLMKYMNAHFCHPGSVKWLLEVLYSPPCGALLIKLEQINHKSSSISVSTVTF